MNCLWCGKEVITGHTNRCISCGLETEVFDVEHGWGNYISLMKYRNTFLGDWKYVPDGCLAIFGGMEI
jgi:hypothetical protein